MTEDGDAAALSADEEEEDDADVIFLEARVRLSEGDFFAAFDHVPGLRVWRAWLWMQPIGALLFLVGSPLPMSRSWLPALGMAAGALPLALFVSWLRRRWAAEAFGVFGPRQICFRFDTDGFEVESNAARERHAWRRLEGVVETERALLLFPTANRLCLLPWRTLEAAEAEQLKALVRANVRRGAPSTPWLKPLLIWLAVCAVLLLLLDR